MDRLKNFIFPSYEVAFIFALLICADVTNYYTYGQVAYLNIFYVPLLISGFYLNKKRALLITFLVVYTAWLYFLITERGAFIANETFDVYFNLSIWSGFMVLVGVLVGHLSDSFRAELGQSNQLRIELDNEREALKQSNEQLSEYSKTLESKVNERTQELEKSKSAIESFKEKMEKVLYSIMDPTVAKMMLDGSLRNEKRRVSVLFSDLKNFGAYSDENPPEKVVQELNDYLSEMEDCIMWYFGHIDKYIGDGIMTEFGAPIHYRMHSLMAVMTGLAMQKRMKKMNFNWEMRIGIATGPAVIGLFGSKRKSYSCIGDTANVASRLETICDIGSIYIDEETYNDVKPYIQAERVYDLLGKRAADLENMKLIDQLKIELETDEFNQEKLFALGQAHFKNRQATQAMECYENIIRMNTEHTEAKLAFAEANIKRDEFEKVAIKGKKGRLAVYKVLGLYDPMMNRSVIPESFYEKYQSVPSKFDLSEDYAFRMEVMDGSVQHGRVVAILSYAIADHLGLSTEEKRDIYFAGYLHDIGKECVPHETLERTGKLSPEGIQELNKHPAEGARMVKDLGHESSSIYKMVESHHESYDGSGYPHGLKGEDIPIGARIIAIADSFNTMTSWRLYSEETWEYKSAIREIQKDATNGVYDPKGVEALRELFQVEPEDK